MTRCNNCVVRVTDIFKIIFKQEYTYWIELTFVSVFEGSKRIGQHLRVGLWRRW